MWNNVQKLPQTTYTLVLKPLVYVTAKAKHIKAYICVAYTKKERKICFQGSVKYRRVDRTVWNHNTMPLPVTLDPLECKKILDISMVQTIKHQTT